MSTSIVHVLSEVRAALNRARVVSLCLDFDGTLVPIGPEPEAPYLDPEMIHTLELLSARDYLRITILSGRAVEDLYRRVRLEELVYAGNHGLEIFGRNISFVEPTAVQRREQLAHLCRDLSVRLRPLAGSLVEYKGLTASVHHRDVSAGDLAELNEAVHAAVVRTGTAFRISPGDEVLEIMPSTHWSRGAAVRWINRHIGDEGVECIYLGDGAEDEEVFQVIPDAITVRVGAAISTSARHRLPDTERVRQFLQWLATQSGPAHLRHRTAS